MPAFRTKPLEVQAERNQAGAWPKIHTLLHISGSQMVSYANSVDGIITVTTMATVLRANRGDWIVKKDGGQILVVPPDLFALLFDPVPAAPPAPAK